MKMNVYNDFKPHSVDSGQSPTSPWIGTPVIPPWSINSSLLSLLSYGNCHDHHLIIYTTIPCIEQLCTSLQEACLSAPFRWEAGMWAVEAYVSHSYFLSHLSSGTSHAVFFLPLPMWVMKYHSPAFAFLFHLIPKFVDMPRDWEW